MSEFCSWEYARSRDKHTLKWFFLCVRDSLNSLFLMDAWHFYSSVTHQLAIAISTVLPYPSKDAKNLTCSLLFLRSELGVALAWQSYYLLWLGGLWHGFQLIIEKLLSWVRHFELSKKRSSRSKIKQFQNNILKVLHKAKLN